jgi:2-pyrone-4,6-dicarboxylate lactonase
MAERTIPTCTSPDPNPHKPNFAVPPGACDTHAHVFGPVARYPLSPKRGYEPAPASAADFRRLRQALGMARGVLTQPSSYGTDNRAMLDAIAEEKTSLRGVAAVGADITDVELERLDAAGIRGIRINLVDPGGNPFDDFAGMARIAARIRPLGWHIEFLVHVHEFADLPRRFGSLDLDIVVGHLGYTRTDAGIDHPGYRDFLAFVAEGRCWIKLTAPYRITTAKDAPYADVAPFARKLVETRPDRLLWGSDWPHVFIKLPMPNDGDLLNLLAEWVPDAATRRRILVDNPAKLYGFV